MVGSPEHIVCCSCGKRVGRRRAPPECPYCGGTKFIKMDPDERLGKGPWWVKEYERRRRVEGE
ncbi:MAG: hypothetical protein GXO28_06665 [Methanopyri archaeon]|nr:hypothetical protein [Methanopyri archaeon]